MNASKYKVPAQLNMPALEAEMLQGWQQEKTFEQSVQLRQGQPSFVFYEGPPSANGMPGIHHVISRTLKDLVCRYKTMRGFQVQRKAGWDTHGLPIELGVEKELGITKEDIGQKISVEEYNKKCREAVVRFKDKWDDITLRMGYWVDLHNPYVTYENKYVESLWWCLKQLYSKGYLYKSVSIQPYSPAAGTGLSSHELNQPGCYREVRDTSATVLFEIIPNESSASLFQSLPENDQSQQKIYVMAWTTTPWTLPSNLGLSVGPQINYALVRTRNPYTHQLQYLILAETRIAAYFDASMEGADFDDWQEGQKHFPYQVLGLWKGEALEGIRYHQLMELEANKPELSGGDPFRIVCGDFVTTEDGTGIVHTAPAFGADDYRMGQKYNLGILTLVDREGKFVEGSGEYSGRYVKNYKDDPNYQDVNVDIAVELKKRGQAFRVEKYEHSYPHCWRTDKPIIYYPLDAWFIRTTAVKDRMVELNKTIQWKPRATGEGRFGNWLENMVDWNLSRSRFWGTPLPVWRTSDGSEEICCGSIAEIQENLHEESPVKHLEDVHKPYIDQVVLKSSRGEKMFREPDLIDVWFDSGAMPYAQWHFPFEAGQQPSQPPAFPADFIAEGVDQTRGWFYTLHALGVLLFDSVAYKTVVSNGLVLDKQGNKMSKRLGNVVDPFDTIARFGADATRWYLVTNASPWDSLKFDLEGIKEAQRKLFNTLYNTYSFFALYANHDGFVFKEDPIPNEERSEMDQWIRSALNTLIKEVRLAMDDYEPTRAGRLIDDFVDEQLSNWYVRLGRRRFWKGEYETDKIAAYQTLYECLETLCRLMAPIAPFFSDWLFRNLNQVGQRNASTSVHHCDFPEVNEQLRNPALETRMQLAQDACSLLLSLRKKANIKVRQPLQKALIPLVQPELKAQIESVQGIILQEVNIKELTWLDGDNTLISKKVKPNFKALGARMGPLMKSVAADIARFTQADIQVLEQVGSIERKVEDQIIVLQREELDIQSDDIPGLLVASKGALTVALDIQVTEALEQEGIAREFINKVQKVRKDREYALTDRIQVTVNGSDLLKTSLLNHNDYICTEILADVVTFSSEMPDSIDIEVNEQTVSIQVIKTN